MAPTLQLINGSFIMNLLKVKVNVDVEFLGSKQIEQPKPGLPTQEQIRKQYGFDISCMAEHFNFLLNGNPLVAPFLPLTDVSIFLRTYQGILLCAIANLLKPNSVDEKTITVKSDLLDDSPEGEIRKMENRNIGITALRSMGVSLTSEVANNIKINEPGTMLGLLVQLLRLVTVGQMHFKNFELLANLFDEWSNEDEASTILATTREKMLLIWINHQLKKAGTDLQLTSIVQNLADSEMYPMLIWTVAPEAKRSSLIPLGDIMKETDLTNRAEFVIANAIKLGIVGIIIPEHISKVGKHSTIDDKGLLSILLNLAFLFRIFLAYPNIDVPKIAETSAAGATTKPEVATPKPEDATAKPEAATPKPEAAISKAKAVTLKAEAATSTPEVATTKPEAETTKPEVATTKPEVETTKPEAETTKPEVATTKPEVATTKPEAETTKPELANTKGKAANTKAKAANTKAKVVNAKAKVVASTTKVTTVKAVVAAPKPEAAAPRPEAATPKPEAATLKPEPAAPKPEAATLKPEAAAQLTQMKDSCKYGTTEDTLIRWLNSFGPSSPVVSLKTDLCSGQVLLEVWDAMFPGCVPWNKVKLEGLNTFAKRKFNWMANCEIAIGIGDMHGISKNVCSSGNISAGETKFIASMVFLMMRLHAQLIRKEIIGDSKVAELDDNGLVKWFNEKMQKFGDPFRLKSLGDVNLKRTNALGYFGERVLAENNRCSSGPADFPRNPADGGPSAGTKTAVGKPTPSPASPKPKMPTKMRPKSGNAVENNLEDEAEENVDGAAQDEEHLPADVNNSGDGAWLFNRVEQVASDPALLMRFEVLAIFMFSKAGIIVYSSKLGPETDTAVYRSVLMELNALSLKRK